MKNVILPRAQIFVWHLAIKKKTKKKKQQQQTNGKG